MEKKKEVFTVTTEDGNKLNLAIMRPTQKHKQEAQKQYNLGFAQSIKAQAPLRAELDKLMKDRGIFDEETLKKREDLLHNIAKVERQLKTGGILLSEARELSLTLRKLRNELTAVAATQTILDSQTAESQAEGRRLEYLISVCIVYNDTGKPYYKDMEAYVDNSEDDVANEGARRLALMLYGLDNDFEKSLPENKFLLDYGFVNDDLSLVNKDGQLIDITGRLINQDGRFVDKGGSFIDIEGNPVTQAGEPIVDFKPFIDDDTGKPVKVEVEVKDVSVEEKEVVSTTE